MSSPLALFASVAFRNITSMLHQTAFAAGLFRVLVALTMVRGVIYAVLNPPFGSPDERDHLQFVAYLATGGGSGEPGRESSQPILYYVLMVPAYLVTLGHSPAIQLLAVRLSSLVFLLGTVWLAWEVGRLVAPRQPALAIGTASIVAFSPENTVIAASANNDAAANLMGALLALLSARLILCPGRTAALLTLPAIGVALMTKGTILPMVVVSLVSLAVYLARNARPVSGRRTGVLLAAAAVVLVIPFQTDSGRFALTRIGMILSGLQGWDESLARLVAAGRWPWIYQFKTFWATFLGDTAQPAAGWYLALATLILLAALGHLFQLRRSSETGATRLGRPEALNAVFVIAVSLQWLTPLFYLISLNAQWFGDQWYRPEWSVQGRYLLPALVPFSILVVAGLMHLSPRTAGRWVPAAVAGLMVAFDINSLLSLGTQYAWPLNSYGTDWWELR